MKKEAVVKTTNVKVHFIRRSKDEAKKKNNYGSLKKESTTAGGEKTSKKNNYNACYVCGLTNHKFAECKYKLYHCKNCNTIEHLAKVCKTGKNHFVEVKVNKVMEMFQDEVESDNSCRLNPITMVVKVENTLIEMEVDSGARISILPEEIVKDKLPHVQINPTILKLRTFFIRMTVQLLNQQVKLKLIKVL